MQTNKNYWNNEELLKTLKSGGCAVMPTDTIYGVVCDALNEGAVKNLYELKKRNPDKPYIVLLGGINAIEDNFYIKLSEEQKDFFGQSFKKPTSIIVDCDEGKFEYLHRGTKSLAFRIPQNPFLKEFLNKSGPLVAPSANTEGGIPSRTIDEAKDYFGDKVDFYLDGGRLESSPSCIVRLLENGTQTIIR